MNKSNLFTGIILLVFIFAFRLKPGNKEMISQFSIAGSKDFQRFNLPDSTGIKIYYASCNGCHKDSIGSLAPGQTIMSAMTPRAINASLTNGKMREQAAKLSEAERKAVAEWITKSALKITTFSNDAYTSFSLAGNTHAFDHSGWGNNKEGTGFRTAQQAGISPASVASLKLKWAFAFPDATLIRSKPAAVGDWLIVGGQFGDVFALNKYTGKIGWNFTASAAIRGAIYVTGKGNAITAFFADYSTNVYALDVKTGKMIWNKRAGFDPQSANTGSVTVYDGKVFVPITSVEVASALMNDYNCCVSSGGVVALDAGTGKLIWQHRIVPNATETGKKKNGKPFYGPSGAPVWCSPTVDAKRGLLYIGTGQNYSYPATNTSDAIMALDLKTGKLAWKFQATTGDMYNVACPFFDNCPDKNSPDFDFGMAPILVKRKDGKEVLVAGQKSGMVYALSPDRGKLIWQSRIGKGGALGGIHWGMATDGAYVYATNSDNSLALNKRDSTINPSPGIYALDLNTGRIAWKTPTPGCPDKNYCLPFNSAAPLAIPGIIFAGSLNGHIRAYAAADGKILWDFDTVKSFETADGFKGKGGAIDGPAPVVSGGMLFVNSGYGMFGQMPGNVLLAFEVDR
ncbi:MAG: PQQ-binding-like beta-propeller repeat protein [Ferruginibacter sp.]